MTSKPVSRASLKRSAKLSFVGSMLRTRPFLTKRVAGLPKLTPTEVARGSDESKCSAPNFNVSAEQYLRKSRRDCSFIKRRSVRLARLGFCDDLIKVELCVPDFFRFERFFPSDFVAT